MGPRGEVCFGSEPLEMVVVAVAWRGGGLFQFGSNGFSSSSSEDESRRCDFVIVVVVDGIGFDTLVL